MIWYMLLNGTIVQLCTGKLLQTLASIHGIGIANYCWLFVLNLNSMGHEAESENPGLLFRFCLEGPLGSWLNGGREAGFRGLSTLLTGAQGSVLPRAQAWHNASLLLSENS